MGAGRGGPDAALARRMSRGAVRPEASEIQRYSDSPALARKQLRDDQASCGTGWAIDDALFLDHGVDCGVYDGANARREMHRSDAHGVIRPLYCRYRQAPDHDAAQQHEDGAVREPFKTSLRMASMLASSKSYGDLGISSVSLDGARKAIRPVLVT